MPTVSTGAWYTRWAAKFGRRTVVAFIVGAVAVAGVAYYYSRASTGVTADAETMKDIPYADQSDEQQLDLYLPARTGTPIPVVVRIHGGGFISGSKNEGDLYMKDAVLEKGWALADINYRLAPKTTFPEPVRDVRQAVRWLKAHANEYGFDNNRFAAWGESAGGYYAEMLGVTGDLGNSIIDDQSADNPYKEYSSAVQAVIALYAPNDFASMDEGSKVSCGSSGAWHNAPDSPESQLLGAPVQTAANLQPSQLATYLGDKHVVAQFYLAHGDKDCTVPYGQSVAFNLKLESWGAKTQLKTYYGLDHADPDIDNGTVEPGIAAAEEAFAAVGPAPTQSATNSPSPSASAQPENSATPVPTQSATATPTPRVTTVATPVASPAATPTASASPPQLGGGYQGDLNQDSKVDLTDLGQMLAGWQNHSTNLDLNGDGRVDALDLSILLSDWNQ